ncbi:MAG: PDZ domain-containing protein [Bradymonadia bacterium]
MFRTLLLATLLAPLTIGTAHAGDPCPIDFTFYDLGAPEWLDRGALLDALTSKDSWIGISFGNGDGGVKITNVSNGSPAQKSGLKIGDVITEAGGKAQATHQAFAQQLSATAPGATLPLKVKRGEEVVDVPLTLSRQDPVIGALIDHASRKDCAKVRRGDLTEEARKQALAAVFDGKRFRCKDAHKALAKANIGNETFEGGAIFVVRGSKRLLLANTQWKTTCIRASKYDGDALTDESIGKVFTRLTKAFVADRFANP